MNRSVFEMHWQYYLSIEKMLVKTNQYVTHSKKNKDAYSDEFASIILLSCSELDSLFRQLCDNYGIQSESKYFKMKDYARVIGKYFGNDFGLATGINTINDDSIIIFPFEYIDATKPYANLKWWKDYQLIKHDRIKNVTKGNLLNAVNSVAAQFIILRELIEFIDDSNGKEYIRKNYWSEYWVPVV
ncbi:hypothetical protein FHP05_14785 [Cerasibacillus terrae]|uniref:Uncharacterized protein n=1 Tax=Cerasibacillus terrae TaxID=2498845 RepID=A0A5C8NGV9_9BACI|nr:MULTISPECIES: hypothetical protein [Bacillaceae]MED4126515.1 hypothetical protein [Halalkalibacterium halodurans]TXL57870.1 hypothetical protein FHP05_14785 [Cerasibacillus terrae]